FVGDLGIARVAQPVPRVLHGDAVALVAVGALLGAGRRGKGHAALSWVLRLVYRKRQPITPSEDFAMSTYEARLAALREQLKADRLDGFVVPLTDEHMSEYVGSYAQRLAWLTGFQGSAGSAVVLPEEAAIFVDGRYTLQVRQQVSATEWSYQSVPETSTTEWLKEHAPEKARIGYDPWLHTRDWVNKAKEALASRGAELVPVSRNPIDEIWKDRPEASKAHL